MNTLHWGPVKGNYRGTLYRYITNVITPHNEKAARAVWLYAIQRYLLGQFSFDDLSYTAVDIYETIYFPFIFDRDFEMVAEDFESFRTPKAKLEIQKYIEQLFADEVKEPYNVEFNKINRFIKNMEETDDENKSAQEILKMYKNKELTLGEVSILAQQIMEKNLPKGPLMTYDILDLASQILPTYFYNPKKATTLTKKFEEKLKKSGHKRTVNY
jgi:hypothetical protein